ncbi:hypothetical protein [Streptomyces sp. NPDC005780]|uniref:hypothetical protein n=1 Tax=Streptomyces sp. NPDC005780 TaxID=3364730 RepID=UPI003693297E
MSNLLDRLHPVVTSPAFTDVATALGAVAAVGTVVGGVIKVLWWVTRLLLPGTGKHRR